MKLYAVLESTTQLAQFYQPKPQPVHSVHIVHQTRSSAVPEKPHDVSYFGNGCTHKAIIILPQNIVFTYFIQVFQSS